MSEESLMHTIFEFIYHLRRLIRIGKSTLGVQTSGTEQKVKNSALHNSDAKSLANCTIACSIILCGIIKTQYWSIGSKSQSEIVYPNLQPGETGISCQLL